MVRVWFIIGAGDDGDEGLIVVFKVLCECPIHNALEGCIKDGVSVSSEVLFDGGVRDVFHRRFLETFTS
jgi:hypothetical protein